MFREAWKIKSIQEAEDAANRETEGTGEKYIACYLGEHVSPRYDVIKLFKIGDQVSKGFNGDYYPVGTIKKISSGPNYRIIETSDGHVFYRRRLSSSWINDGTWSLVRGWVDERNPSF